MAVEPFELQPGCECGICDGELLPLGAWAVAGGNGFGKGADGTDLIACAPGHCPATGVVIEEHEGWRVCGRAKPSNAGEIRADDHPALEAFFGPSPRDLVGRAMLARFEEGYKNHGASYDPDTVWEAVDDALAALAGLLVGQPVRVVRVPGVIGAEGFETEPPADA